MSEYQYYEFAALDRPLTRAEMAELRAVSSRAVITPTRFTNHYEWGDLKADPGDWMACYFDAFVYWAGWGSCQLSLRVPKTAFSKAELRTFVIAQSVLSVESSDSHWIFDWMLDESDDYLRFAEDDGSGWMQRLVPLRDELLRGDRRPLYLGWLAGSAAMADDELEPEVPPGLMTLTPAQQALVEFLAIDPDLVEAAGAGSAPLATNKRDEAKRIAAWLTTWKLPDLHGVLERIALGQGLAAEREVKAHYATWLRTHHPPATSTSPRRRVDELLERARSASAIRRRREARARTKQEAERQRRHEAALQRMMAEPDAYWKMANAAAKRGVAAGYDEALRLLSELAEAYALVAEDEAFTRELRRFVVFHGKRAALLRRLDQAGLLGRVADAGLWPE